MIIAQEKVSMPLTPSHVESLTPDGFYLGAHDDIGVAKRPIGYDAGQFSSELLLTLAADPAMDAAFYAFLDKHVGEPYDFSAILGFILPEHEHQPEHAICSALMTLGLRACGWFATPVAAPAHLIDPRDLLLMISGRMLVPGI